MEKRLFQIVQSETDIQEMFILHNLGILLCIEGECYKVNCIYCKC
jgi:hypothetical protein